ncbi:MAG TPA: hypothetical protein PLF48_03610 [Chitinophagales bacterium]|nr:hypothetical protein [Chitinophagales bacterium]
MKKKDARVSKRLYMHFGQKHSLSFFNSGIFLFTLFYLLTLLLYFESRHSGFVTDYIGFEQNYDHCDYWHYYHCSGGKNFRYLQHAFSYPIYKYIGSDSLIWYLLYCLAHALTALVGYKTLIMIFAFWNKALSKKASFFTALLFLVSPFHNEVLVWRVCIQYMTISICLFLSMRFFLLDIKKNNFKYPVASILLFIIGLLSLEQIIVMPVFIFLLSIFVFIIERQKPVLTRMFSWYFLPQTGLIILYFLMSKIVYGQWVMHYGSDTFKGFNSISTVSKIYNYFIKYFALVRFYPHEWKSFLFAYIECPLITLFLITCTGLGLFYLLKKFIRGNIYSGTLLLMICFYIVSLIPVLQLYFSVLFYCENDRLGYLSSFFIFGIIVLILYKLPILFRYFLLLILFTVNLFFAYKMSHLWKRSTEIYTSYLTAFNDYPYKQVFLLGTPDNYQGIPMMRAYPSGLQEALQYRRKKPYTGKMYDVMQFNQVSKEDGMHVEQLNDSTLKVSFTHNGSWFWYWGIGAKSYETPDVKVSVNQWNYIVTFKNFNRANSIILYPYQSKWMQVKWE